MVTFEEFFVKKKIDLKRLEADDQALYREFREHYALMGEKSFDHTKKFWFNRLRKSYLLQEALPVKPVASRKESSIPSVADHDAVKTSTTKPAGFKPRFKGGVTKTAEKPQEDPVQTEQREETEKTTSKPAGFKPRFKAGVTKTAEKPQEDPVQTEQKEETEKTTSKPAGFKPRFKAGVTKTAEKPQEDPVQTEQKEETEKTTSKPAGFKPRFKAGVTGTQPKKTKDEDNEST